MDMNDIYAAEERIKPYLSPTPLLYSNSLRRELNKHIWLKLETQLPTGTFKPRPAFNSILCQLDLARKKGVLASSSGNFAQGVAYAARELGVSAVIVMAENTSPFKIERTKKLGAEVVLCGNAHQDRLDTVRRLEKETGRVFLDPYDTYDTIAGDGTIGLELAKELGDKLNEITVLVPVSGGGLVAGIAFALKHLYPKCKVIGVQPKANGSLAQSFKAGKCVQIDNIKTVADALAAGSPGENAFKIIKEYLDDVIEVEEDQIKSATQFFIEQHKLVVEPGGSVPVAALFANKVKSDNVVCITSGGNINLWKAL